MQTFVPFINWADCARVTDDHPSHSRSANQRLEGYQVLNHLLGNAPKHYPNHPINPMWRGYEPALAIYVMQFCLYRYLERGLNDVIFFDTLRIMQDAGYDRGNFDYRSPPWREDTDVMRSHRSALFRKNPAHYRQFRQKGDHDWPYVWPRCDDEGGYTLWLSGADSKRVKAGELALPKATQKRIENYP